MDSGKLWRRFRTRGSPIVGLIVRGVDWRFDVAERNQALACQSTEPRHKKGFKTFWKRYSRRCQIHAIARLSASCNVDAVPPETGEPSWRLLLGCESVQNFRMQFL